MRKIIFFCLLLGTSVSWTQRPSKQSQEISIEQKTINDIKTADDLNQLLNIYKNSRIDLIEASVPEFIFNKEAEEQFEKKLTKFLKVKDFPQVNEALYEKIGAWGLHKKYPSILNTMEKMTVAYLKTNHNNTKGVGGPYSWDLEEMGSFTDPEKKPGLYSLIRSMPKAHKFLVRKGYAPKNIDYNESLIKARYAARKNTFSRIVSMCTRMRLAQ